MKGQVIGTVKCWLHGGEVRVKHDKNENPYFYCDHCGMRVQFVGYDEGLAEFNKHMKKVPSRGSSAEPFPAAAPIGKEPAPAAKKKGSLLPWGDGE